MLDVVKKVAPSIPFDADRLDRLMDEAGIDVLPTMVGPSKSRPLMSHRKSDLGILCR